MVSAFCGVGLGQWDSRKLFYASLILAGVKGYIYLSVGFPDGASGKKKKKKKNLIMQETKKTRVQTLGQEDALEGLGNSLQYSCL